MAAAVRPLDERLHDAIVLHRIALSRYSTAKARKAIAQLNRIELDVLARLARADNESVTGQRLEVLLAEVRNIEAAGWQVLKDRIGEDVVELAANETAFSTGVVRQIRPIETPVAATAVTVDVFSAAPTVAQVMGAVSARPFQGRFLKDWLDGLEESVAAKVRDTIRQGYVEGRPTADIVRALRGTRANSFKDGVLETTRRETEAMVRTALTHTATVAQGAVYAANADVITGLIWTSTLDNRTTLICISRSEQVFPVDSGPRPPAHFNCRSIMRPQVKPIPGVAPYKAPSYPEWLKKQSAATQDDVLGATRGKLFRDGGLSVDRFVDKTGKSLTLEQLRSADASAFARAGLQ